MSVRAQLPGDGRGRVLQNAAVRVGVYTGVGLALIFTAWVFVANRIAASENFADERNLAAAAALGLLAAVSVIRFFRLPGNLLASSLIAWSILTVTYWGLSVHFWGLTERYSAFQIFTLGSVSYMIIATVSWIGTCIWRVRHSNVSHSNHHVS